MRPKKSVVPSVDSPVESLSVDIPTAAKMLGGTVRAVRGLIWSKQIPFIKIGKKHCVPVEALRAFVQREAA